MTCQSTEHMGRCEHALRAAALGVAVGAADRALPPDAQIRDVHLDTGCVANSMKTLSQTRSLRNFMRHPKSTNRVSRKTDKTLTENDLALRAGAREVLRLGQEVHLAGHGHGHEY